MFDFIFNGQGSGDVASRLLACNMDPNALRPWVDEDGRAYIAVNQGGNLVSVPISPNVQVPGLVGNVANVLSSGSTLRKEEWVRLDEAVVRTLRPALRMWNDLRTSNSYTIPNAMNYTVLQHQGMSDFGKATISMDGLRKSERDRPTFDLRNLPLPIIHSDFSFSLREVAVSRNGGPPLDTLGAEQAAYQCAVALEKLTAGTSATYSYGGGTIYGWTNYPDRITVVLTNPTAGGWTAATTVNEILNMIQTAALRYMNGPYRMYYSPSWGRFFDADYNSTRGNSLRQRLQEIDRITSMAPSDYLTGYQVLLVGPNAGRAVVGMDFQTIQWQEQGGMELNFKIMGILVPQIRSTFTGDVEIIHGTAP